jgi:hypothetical protein
VEIRAERDETHVRLTAGAVQRFGGKCSRPAHAAWPSNGRSAGAPSCSRTSAVLGPLFLRQQAVALRPLARQLMGAPNRLALLARSLFGRLLIGSALLQFAKYTFTLHFLLQDTHSLVDIIFAHEYLQNTSSR